MGVPTWILVGGGACWIVILAALGVWWATKGPAASVVAIKAVSTGKYLAVSADGYIRPTANSTAGKETHFRMITISASMLAMLRPHHQQNKASTRLGCPCTGFTDEHGFGKFCHGWESEYHRPWCYVGNDCRHAHRDHHRPRKHQNCKSEEGTLGPAGWNPPKGCPCNGHESVHGFGGTCVGWEYPGQRPWCYVDANCSALVGSPSDGALGSRFIECVSNVTEAPSPPPSPPPPPPPPLKWVESKGGWGTSDDCKCNGYSNTHGMGAFCKGWEFDKQTPWCPQENFELAIS